MNIDEFIEKLKEAENMVSNEYFRIVNEKCTDINDTQLKTLLHDSFVKDFDDYNKYVTGLKDNTDKTKVSQPYNDALKIYNGYIKIYDSCANRLLRKRTPTPNSSSGGKRKSKKHRKTKVSRKSKKARRSRKSRK